MYLGVKIKSTSKPYIGIGSNINLTPDQINHLRLLRSRLGTTNYLEVWETSTSLANVWIAAASWGMRF